MHLLRLLVIGLATAALAGAQDVARMDEVVRAHAEGNHYRGAVLVAKGGDIVFDRAYGQASEEWSIPNAPDTRFRIGSVTKQFTAAAILLLEQDGRLSVEDPISKYVPEAPEAWQPITLRHLLAHTSGVPSFTDQPDYNELKRAPLNLPKTMARMVKLPLEFKPGEKYAYSNTGYLLLSHVIQQVSGKSYAEFLRERIFQPLGMKDTDLDSDSAIIPRKAAGYMLVGGRLQQAPFINMQVPLGAGAIYSTTHDLLRWTTALMEGRVVNAASLVRMTTPGKGDYGFGLVIRTVNGRRLINHEGSIEGFTAYLGYYPDSKVTVVVLANMNSAVPPKLGAALGELAHGGKVVLPNEHKAVTVPVATLQRYVGVYQLRPKITMSVRCPDGQLTVQLSGQGAMPVFPESETRFFYKAVDAQIDFKVDAAGKVTDLVLHQNGRDQQAPRISDTVVERKEIPLPADKLAGCVGVYQLRPGFDLTITLQDGQLYSQATGQKAAPLFAESETKFFLKVVDAQVEFTRDATGKVTQLTLHQGPAEITGPRKP